MEEWKEYKLEDVCESIYSGGTPSTMNKEYWNGDLPWLSSGETGQKYIYSTEKTITQKGVDNSSTRYAFKDSTVVASAGQGYTRGQASYLKIDTYINQSVIVLKPNPKIIDSKFLFFNIDNRYRELRQLSDGTSTRGSLSGKIMKDLLINLPPLPTQQKIAAILSSLDDKIELNNKINENLEQQAQALFKSWFVNFEPFGGKMPEGWKVGKLGEFVEIKRGGSPRPIQKYLSDTGYRWLKISDVTSLSSPFVLNIAEHIKEDGLSKTVFLKSGSLVLSNSATPGIPKILDLDTCIHDGWLYFPKSQLSNEYLYLLFKEIRPQLVNLGNGSIFTNLKTDILKNFEISMPSEETLSKFQNIIKPIFEKILSSQREIKHLENLRDTLLPKLMNGEILT